MIRRLMCRWFGHAWRATHCNRWFIDTRRQCDRCGAVEVWRGGPAGSWHPGDVEA